MNSSKKAKEYISVAIQLLVIELAGLTFVGILGILMV